MVNQASGKLLHIEPLQFDVLLQSLEAQTPPKTRCLFSMRQVVERLYDFIARSVENHYEFDELAVMIHQNLLKLDDVGEVPEIKGATLKQYFLEVKRDRETGTGRRKSGALKTGAKTKVRQDSPVVKDVVEMPLETPLKTTTKLPAGRSAKVELAY
jgi:hypothetical protein